MSAIPSPSGDRPPFVPNPAMAAVTDPVAAEADDSWQWLELQAEPSAAGGRTVLGWALALLAAAWIGYSAWSAGRALATQPLDSPLFAQWLALTTGPLALLGLTWLMFGRTRRREAEKFTRSVVAMRHEARALEAMLGAMTQRIADSHAALGRMSGDLVIMGEDTAARLGAVTGDLNSSAVTLHERGSALDRAAERARIDIGTLLDDLPRAETIADSLALRLRGAATDATERTAGFDRQVGLLTDRAREADVMATEAAARLGERLAEIERVGTAAAERIGDITNSGDASVDALLARSAEALDRIRGGINEQAAAVGALVAEAGATLGRSGIEASDALGQRIDHAGRSLDALSARIAEQDRASQRLVADLDDGLAGLDQRFAALAASGDQRAVHVQQSIARLREEIDGVGSSAGVHDAALTTLVDRTAAVREGLDSLVADVRGTLQPALAEIEAGQRRLTDGAVEVQPLIGAIRDATAEAGRHLAASQAATEQQLEQLGELLRAVDSGVGGAQRRLADLSGAITQASGEAERLSGETGPALVAAMVQVREAAAHAGDRARAAIAAAIPDSAAELGEAARVALEQAVREAVEDRLAEVDQLAARAIDAARGASDRLTAQMLTIGQTASALEDHVERIHAAQKKDDGEEFARRVSLLMDSMNSAAIDVQKILSDEVDERAWTSYLKGNRGIFTRRAVRLLGRSEDRALGQHYARDGEFQDAANRYVADFEAMLRRIMAEREGGMIAVTLMGSDMGKLYAALAPLVERRR